MAKVIGVDTGGTFTDVVVLNEDGTRISAKSATTADDLQVGIIAAVTEAARQVDLTVEELLDDAALFRLSGTTVTNALLTGRGIGATGMVTTRGFEDTLHIGRGISAWAGGTEEEIRRVFRRTKPAPLIPKRLVRGVSERIGRAGEVLVELDEEAVTAVTEELVSDGVESIAVGFLWAVRNPSHELRARELIEATAPQVSVHLSHEVAPSIGEYQRFATAAADALAGPIMERLLRNLRDTLTERGFNGELLVAQADGGAVHAADSRPVYTLSSGPAAGVMVCATEGAAIGLADIVTADVGGTSFDVGVVADGTVEHAREPVVGQHSISLPMIDVESVGTGGGSIAWLDELDVLHVGPQSAGASPGPVCYGLGGTEPTVTDASVILGYVNPDYFLGGRVQLDYEGAEEALRRLGEGLGFDPVQTAAGIFEIANAQMAGLIERRVLSRGFDPRDFSVLAYGGAGGMHAAFYAREARIQRVVVPALAGTFSAYGVATAPLLHTARREDFGAIPMEADRFRSNFEELELHVTTMLEQGGVAVADRTLRYVLEMRYGVQLHTVRLELDQKAWNEADFDAIGSAFDERYERHYGKGSGYADAGRFVTSFIVEGHGALAIPEQAADPLGAPDASGARVGSRPLYFGGAFLDGAVYRHAELRAGNTLTGPAIIEAPEMTVVVPPEFEASVDQFANVHLRAEEAE